MDQRLLVPTKDGRCDEHKPGEIVSVYHRAGRRLIMSRCARWVAMEEGDPHWVPVEALRAVIPQHDKMIRSAHNKEVR